MSTSPRFHVREAETARGDGEFIIAAFDAALPYLTSIGSQEQWGSIPFSQRDNWNAETLQQVHDAEVYRLTGSGDALRILIVEAKVPGQESRDHTSQTKPEDVVPVGFAFTRENGIPKYVLSQEHLQIEDAEGKSCVYIEVMVTDHRASRPGSGAALIRGIKEFGKKKRRKTLSVDGWAGNEKKLVRYYERQGFQAVGDFSLPRKDKTPWLGTLLRMDIEP